MSQGAVEPSVFFDEDGAAVIEKAEEKKQELQSITKAFYDTLEKATEELMEMPTAGIFPNPVDMREECFF